MSEIEAITFLGDYLEAEIMSEIDYRELLKKYIAHVGECEGITFLSEYYFTGGFDPQPLVFSKEEKSELRKLEAEVKK